jgi:cysteine protease ATG4
VDVSEKKGNPLLSFIDSVIEKVNSKEETEMKEIVNIVSPADQRETVGSYDICREYSYSGDEDDSNYITYPPDLPADPADTHLDGGSGGNSLGGSCYVLGKLYHQINDYDARRDDESSLFWFTYRCDFPSIEPYGITSDAGWGCMLRATQMLLAQALRLHYKSREWRPTQSLASRRKDPFVRSVLTWFADFPSSSESMYSLHNMVAAGLSKYEKLPGEWYGPGTACYVLRDLVQMHERQQLVGKASQDRKKIFRVHVAPQGSVYRDSVKDLMTKDIQVQREKERKKKEKECPPKHPLDVSWEEELIESSLSGVKDVEWDTSLLLLIPLRLGLKSFNADYVRAVAHTFSLPQSVGVLGGRPRGARWFYGALADGSKIFGLDPHTVQNAPRRRTARVNGKSSSVVEISDDFMTSVHTTYPEVFSLERMDPSIALGFYCRDNADLEEVLSSMERWKEENPDFPELFTVADAAPDYSANVTSVMNEMAGSLLDDGTDQESDEDEYVML